MKVLVTGSGGQLGKALARTVPDGVHLIALDRQDLDIADEVAVNAALLKFRPDSVINAAAYTSVDAAEDEPEKAMLVNAEAVGFLSDACQKCDIHLVHISTDYVFGGAHHQSYAVSAKRNPLSTYGRSKALGEDALAGGGSLVRTSWVYDAGSANFVTSILGRLRRGEAVRVVDDEFGSPTWARGLAELVWQVAQGKQGGKFHHCDAGVVSRWEFAQAIAQEASRLELIGTAAKVEPIKSAEYARKATRPARVALDTASTHEALGYRAMPWRENLRRMLSEVVAHA